MLGSDIVEEGISVSHRGKLGENMSAGHGRTSQSGPPHLDPHRLTLEVHGGPEWRGPGAEVEQGGSSQGEQRDDGRGGQGAEESLEQDLHDGVSVGGEVFIENKRPINALGAAHLLSSVLINQDYFHISPYSLITQRSKSTWVV